MIQLFGLFLCLAACEITIATRCASRSTKQCRRVSSTESKPITVYDGPAPNELYHAQVLVCDSHLQASHSVRGASAQNAGEFYSIARGVGAKTRLL